MSAPDYYATLSISKTATQTQIRDAYKRAALKWHPDRVPSDSPERPERTRRFQAINDAYYTLSDPGRRREYDAARAYTGYAGTSPPGSFEDDEDVDEEIPRPAGAAGGFSFPGSSFFGFGGANAAGSSPPEPNQQFGSVFEEMLREEGMDPSEAPATGKFWSLVGGASGGALGFIVANAPGAVVGAVAGNRLGAVRDKRGKSVYAVFLDLPQADKARLLSEMAAKVFGLAVGS